MKILEQNKNILLSRTNLILEEDHVGNKTPSNKEVSKKIAGLLKTKEELVKIKHIYTKYGQGKSKIIANVYNSLEKLKEIEDIKKKKPKVKKEAPKEAPPKKEEKQKEEVKKEKKEDAKESKTKEQKAE